MKELLQSSRETWKTPSFAVEHRPKWSNAMLPEDPVKDITLNIRIPQQLRTLPHPTRPVRPCRIIQHPSLQLTHLVSCDRQPTTQTIEAVVPAARRDTGVVHGARLDAAAEVAARDVLHVGDVGGGVVRLVAVDGVGEGRGVDVVGRGGGGVGRWGVYEAVVCGAGDVEGGGWGGGGGRVRGGGGNSWVGCA